MNVFKGVCIFLLGAATGGIIAWKLTEKKYNEELEVIEYKEPEDREEQKMAKETKIKPSIMDYWKEKNDKIIEEKEYKTEDKEEPESESIPESDVEELKDVPYSISLDDFGEFDDYEKVELYYFSDNILADDNYDMYGAIDVEETVGNNFSSHIGDYEDGVAYIRNDTLKTDYEIRSDSRKYHQALRES